MVGFIGFPEGKQSTIPIPALFFSELMPQIDHLAEMQVTLYCFWALNAQEGSYRYIRWREASQDEVLLTCVSQFHGDPVDLIRDGFERAVVRGTLLHVNIKLGPSNEDIYFMNTEKGRAAIQAVKNGEWTPGDEVRPIALITARPNIFVKYEQNIGALTPIIAQQLRDLEKDFSLTWLEEAIEMATNHNVRRMNYIIGILKRWQRDGRTDGKQQDKPVDNRRHEMEQIQRKLGLWQEDEPNE